MSKRQKDTALRHADKIQARAIKRAGELLKLIEPGAGRPKEFVSAPVRINRESAATDAGMSKRQKDTALRVASVPTEVFDF